MKFKILFIISLLFLAISVSGQNTAKLYKSGQWLDIKKHGSWAKAMKSTIYEKVEILQTDKAFKVTLGNKIYSYKIISSSEFSDVQIRYAVTLNNKSYEIVVSENSPGTFTINIEKEWMVHLITNVSTVIVN